MDALPLVQQPVAAPESPQTPLAAANRMLFKLLTSAAPAQIALIPVNEVSFSSAWQSAGVSTEGNARPQFYIT